MADFERKACKPATFEAGQGARAKKQAIMLVVHATSSFRDVLDVFWLGSVLGKIPSGVAFGKRAYQLHSGLGGGNRFRSGLGRPPAGWVGGPARPKVLKETTTIKSEKWKIMVN